MNLNEQAAMMIRSLMRDLRVSDHLIHQTQEDRYISANKLIEELKDTRRIPTPSEVVEYIDTFKRQATLDDIGEFIQKAGRFLNEKRTREEWMAEPELLPVVTWVEASRGD